MKAIKYALIFLLIAGFTQTISARESIPNPDARPDDSPTTTNELRSDCLASVSQIDLNVNNVRARLLGGGDLWWDLSEGSYIIPNVDPGQPEVSAMFAAALWLGGYDAAGNLKLAAQTYRQTGNDFWPGPIDNTTGETELTTCLNWDRHFKVNASAIQDLQSDYLNDDNGDGQPDYTVDDTPDVSLLQWPARGNPYFTDYFNFSLLNQDLAPFYDENGDGIYNPYDGDIPTIGLSGCGVSYADQMIWWVYNDVGNTHGETGGDQIGMEIQALAFAYSTNNEINDMSFYKYKLLNKATGVLFDTYIGQWADADLGCWDNDYVGCQPDKALGIIYNGEATDPDCTSGGGIVNGYGTEVPMLGIDFFRGPKDENGNELGMSAFVYYNNNFSVTGNPDTAEDYYGYLSGFWKDDSPIEYGGNGYQQGTFPTPYMFPTDPSNTASGAWSECSENNLPADRRFIQSSGPFTMNPGAINEVVIGVVWVPDVQYPCPTFDKLLEADSTAQNLFDDCFGVAVAIDEVNLASPALDDIQVFPSPCYAACQEVSITNLPPKSIVSIYGVDGRLIRTMQGRTIHESSYYWDKKGHNGQTVPTGVYVIHVDATAAGLGTKAIKWMGGS